MRGLHYIEEDIDELFEDWIARAYDWETFAHWLEVWS